MALSVIKNRTDAILFLSGILKSVNLHFINGITVTCKNFADFMLNVAIEVHKQTLLRHGILIQIKPNFIKFKTRKGEVKLFYSSSDKEQIKDNLGAFVEQFVCSQYDWLNTKDHIVVDIGAYIGDSAIYFALNGAKHVYALEPYPYAYGLSVKNIKINNLEGKVTIINEGIGSKNTFITVNKSYKSRRDDDIKLFKEGKKIRITTLDELVKRFNIKDAVLKIDCEGAEYDVILNTSTLTLRKFKQMIIEYHYGYENLERKLSAAGFTCRHTTPIYSFNSRQNQHAYIGLLFAERSKL